MYRRSEQGHEILFLRIYFKLFIKALKFVDSSQASIFCIARETLHFAIFQLARWKLHFAKKSSSIKGIVGF